MSRKHKIIGFFSPFKHFAPTQSTLSQAFKSGEEGGGCGGGGEVGISEGVECQRRWVSVSWWVSTTSSVLTAEGRQARPSVHD